MTLIADLVLERRDQQDNTVEFYLPNGADGDQGVVALFTPPISPDYWQYRVMVCDGQAVVGFPKFTTIGIGFAVEDDWNANLPYTSEASDIANHIWHNRGPLPDDVPSFDLVVRAVQMIQEAATADREVPDE